MDSLGSDVMLHLVSFIGCRHQLLAIRCVNRQLRRVCDRCPWICHYEVNSRQTMRHAYRNRDRIVSLRWNYVRHITFDLPHLIMVQSNLKEIRFYGRVPQLYYIDATGNVNGGYSPEPSPVLELITHEFMCSVYDYRKEYDYDPSDYCCSISVKYVDPFP